MHRASMDSSNVLSSRDNHSTYPSLPSSITKGAKVTNNPFYSSTLTSTSSSRFFKEKIDSDIPTFSDGNGVVSQGRGMSHPHSLENSKPQTSASTSTVEAIEYSRPLVIFGHIDLTGMAAWLQYLVLSLGLLIFMCLYGYFQELVAYNYFERRLTVFSTFLHFLGCFVVAHGQRESMSMSRGVGRRVIGSLLTMGSAPRKIGVFYYAMLISLKTVSQGLTNLSMTQINYPAKVLFKSATPVINMIIGLLWFRRRYPSRDYLVVSLLVIGLYIFVNGDAEVSPEGTGFGIILVTVAMFCGAAVPMVQEHCINKYNATVEELLYHSFLGSSLISLLVSFLSGELSEGCHFIISHGNIYVWSTLVSFSVVGFCGSNFSTGLTLRFGSLINGITNTYRKAVTLGLSFALFPSRNHLTHQHVYGAMVFFVGLIVRTISKDRKSHSDSRSDDSVGVGVVGDSAPTASSNITSDSGFQDVRSQSSEDRGVAMAMEIEREDDMDVEIGPILAASSESAMPSSAPSVLEIPPSTIHTSHLERRMSGNATYFRV